MNEEVRFPTTSQADNKWLFFTLITVALWGVWGAFSSVSAQNGFPDTLVYCVWSLTMILPTLVVLHRGGWKIDKNFKAIWHGMAIGILGAGGQMILFYALTKGPAYYIFPIISVSPLVTIFLSALVLKERTNTLGIAGVILSLIALPMFDLSLGQGAANGGDWFLLSILIMVFWGVQGFFMKYANEHMSGESIFFYMTLAGLIIAPVALLMTDFSHPINWGLNGPLLAAAIQILNAIGALTLVFAFRHGKAIIVSPLSNAGAPLLTAVISLMVAGVVPGQLKILGLILATIASILLAMAG